MIPAWITWEKLLAVSGVLVIAAILELVVVVMLGRREFRRLTGHRHIPLDPPSRPRRIRINATPRTHVEIPRPWSWE
jgi:hypothetical protein